ncbi:hypothetical protein G3578_16870 [Brevibacillus sp. SYP-B805]|uniref:hypothetical protein n=1 Tax=Brevibacillus sp. SYP-B805 TaxID=1578199 RepID=UPI0013EA03A8|nr:hypothetical protein [Brevibacillus sp. SYP-B805]NGQ96840.1 hypothetical protein [Brevibacillus sp. SYP-B805]
MKFASVSNDFFKLCSFDKELLENSNRRPYLIIVKLKYNGKRQDFAIPLRSNISSTTPREQYFPLPPRKSTSKGRKHGLHYIKMFPIRKEFLQKFHTDKDPYYQMLVKFIDKRKKQIITEAQEYLDKYESGYRFEYATDIHGIYLTLQEAFPAKEAAYVVESSKDEDKNL